MYSSSGNQEVLMITKHSDVKLLLPAAALLSSILLPQALLYLMMQTCGLIIDLRLHEAW